jgi:methylthioribose-1-phosphate isomerase
MAELIEHLRWDEDCLLLLDQTLLPTKTDFLKINCIEECWEAIKVLRVRGAPAIGVAAAFGMYLGLRTLNSADWSASEFVEEARKNADYLSSARPTAVNLRWAVDRIVRLIEAHPKETIPQILDIIKAEAISMIAEDNEVCKAIGRHGVTLLKDGAMVLTHCNAGGLATARYGTALSPIYAAQEKGMRVGVFADETRPLLQGSRLTAYELQRAGIPVTLICDNMAAMVMAQKKVDLVIVGADRVTANGDFANKIGTYGVAILAKEHGIPFYCATPLSTIDMSLAHGGSIPIEERKSEEITHGFGRQTAPDGINVFNPAFDVTPHRYVTAFITERGVVKPPFEKNLSLLFGS